MTIADEVETILLEHGEMPGRDLRNRLNQGKWFWQKWGLAGFYNLMAKLEDQGVVAYRTRTKLFFDDTEQRVDFRIYRATKGDLSSDNPR